MKLPSETTGGYETKPLEDKVLDLFEETRRVLHDSCDIDTGEDNVAPIDFDCLFSALDHNQLIALLQGNTPGESEDPTIALDSLEGWATAKKMDRLLRLASKAFTDKQDQRDMDLIGGRAIIVRSRCVPYAPGIRRLIGGEMGQIQIEITGIVRSVSSEAGEIHVQQSSGDEDERAVYCVNTFNTNFLRVDKDNLLTDFHIIS